MLGRVVSVTEDVVFLADVGVHSLGDGSRNRILQAADAFTHVNCFLAMNVILMLEVTGQSLLKTVCNPLRQIPSCELDARLLAPLYPLLVVVFGNWCASISRAVTLQVVCTSARMIVRSVLATKASYSGARVMSRARPR